MNGARRRTLSRAGAIRLVAAVVFTGLLGAASRAADYPQPAEADYVIRDFKFASGESLPELRIHYRFLGRGAPARASSIRCLPASFSGRASRSTPPACSSSCPTG